MFTGIVSAMGEIAQVDSRGEDLVLGIRHGSPASLPLQVGDSVAVAGACLTAIVVGEGVFSADVSRATLACTTLGSLRVGDAVNLESALVAGAPFGGHFVTGHVDGVGTLRSILAEGRSLLMEIDAPAGMTPLLAAKGSVTVDGVSLTVNAVRGSRFTVNLVPHTARVTTLGRLRAGAQINLEADLLARYLERLLAERNAPD